MKPGTRILFIGEIVGKAGIYCIKKLLSRIKDEYGIDFVIAAGEGATGGFGIGKNHSIYLHKLGIDVLTGGECIYYKLDMVTHIKKAPYVLRPANYPPGNPGRGWWIYTVGDKKIAVVDLLGQSGFNRVHLSNPYTFLPEIISRITAETNIIIVDFHAATTAEKSSMFYHVDGVVSAVIGTHFKVLTADARILPGGTAVITDVGRCGSIESVGGLDPEIEIKKFLTGVPERSNDAWAKLELQGVLIDIDERGKAAHIEIIRKQCENPEHEGNSNGS
jgi:2',3'-cyclic-nucleotide 2'-phosphodiesterase